MALASKGVNLTSLERVYNHPLEFLLGFFRLFNAGERFDSVRLLLPGFDCGKHLELNTL